MSCDFGELKGKVLHEIKKIEDRELLFITKDNITYRMYHEKDCCESVSIDDICGELEWLVDSPILLAEERDNHIRNEEDSSTWTFYEIATLKGAVTIRWYGTSNGYYSESVDFEQIKREL